MSTCLIPRDFWWYLLIRYLLVDRESRHSIGAVSQSWHIFIYPSALCRKILWRHHVFDNILRPGFQDLYAVPQFERPSVVYQLHHRVPEQRVLADNGNGRVCELAQLNSFRSIDITSVDLHDMAHEKTALFSRKSTFSFQYLDDILMMTIVHDDDRSWWRP